ncbi:MAG: pectin acetylesterase-family hydrolase [Meiothermus sp.]|nr:pectin acetylesterase-family hydrolase [Meiothermus sp.]
MQRWLGVLVVLVLGLGWAQSQPQGIAASSGWQEIAGPEGTMCSDGSPWKFYVALGNPQRIVIDFQGGGACWNDGTCSPQSTTFTRTLQVGDLRGAQGIYNRASQFNPLRDWTHVFIPYCTADIHVGNNAKQYATATVQHKGAVNARAALDWVFRNLTAPQNVFVTGCSAGAYGAAAWSPYIMRQYPNVRVVQLGDAGLGVTNEAFRNVGYANWNITSWLPSFIPELEAVRSNVAGFDLATLYVSTLRAFPNNFMAQYSTALDSVQIGFYGLMKGQTPDQIGQATATEWVQGALGNLGRIEQAFAGRFSSYLAPGSQHCVIPRPEFYTLRVGDVSFAEWVARLIQTGSAPDVSPPR